MPTFRKFTRRLFVITNLIAVVLFLLACANAFLHPGRWWIISLLGLVFPLLLVALLGCLVLGLFFPSCRRWSLVSFVTLLVGWSNIHSFLAFHPGKAFMQEKPPHSIRIFTWNVRSFDEFTTRKMDVTGHRPLMMDFIGQQNADVLCLQEFYENRGPKGGGSNIAYIRQQLHYPYYFFSRDYVHNDISESGVIIFSRYPIVDRSIMHYTKGDGIKATESLISATLQVGTDTIRVFTTHLQSVLFRSKDFHDIEIIKNVDDSILEASRSIAKKLKYAFRQRGDQAEAARDELNKSAYPTLITGDFNDVPNSYTYFTILGGWKDAFIGKGFGIGRTYLHISPTLRIDYIMADPRLAALQCKTFSIPWSDHSPVMADLSLVSAP